MRQVHRIEISDAAMIRRIIQIHDEIPRAWNPAHHVSQDYLDKLLERVLSGAKPQGFWILSRTEPVTPDTVDGMIWASIEDSLGTPICGINSFWIHPGLRNQVGSEELAVN